MLRSGMSVDIPTMMVGNKFIYNLNWMISWENITQVTEIQKHEFLDHLTMLIIICSTM